MLQCRQLRRLRRLRAVGTGGGVEQTPQGLNSKRRGFAGAGLVQPHSQNAHSQNAHSQNAHSQNADYRGGSEDSAPHDFLLRYAAQKSQSG